MKQVDVPRRALPTLGGALLVGGAALALAACDPSAEDPEATRRTPAPTTPAGPSDGGGSATPSATPTGTPGPLLFDARFADAGFGAYASYAPQGAVEGEDFGVDEDPLGVHGRVAWFDSRRGLHVGTPYPRAQALTPPFIEAGGEYWVLYDVLVPAESAPPAADDWITLGTGAFGAPFGDSSPLGIAVVRSRESGLYLQVGGDYRILEERVTAPVDRWMRIIEGFGFSADGWAEISLGIDGEEPRALRAAGRKAGRFPLVTEAQGINDGAANASRIGVYGSEPARIWFANHRVASSREALLAGL